jgi:hypothetical protein
MDLMDYTSSQHAVDAVGSAATAATAATTSAQTQVGSSSKHQKKEHTKMEVEEGQIVCPGPTSAALAVHFVPVKMKPEFLYPLLNMRVPVAILHLTPPQLTKSERHYKVLAVFSSAANADVAFNALSGEESFDNYGLPMKQHSLIEGVTIYVTNTLETTEQSMNAHKVLKLESATVDLS